MAGILAFPSLLLREQSVCWEIVGNVVAGGRTGDDAATLVRTDGGGLWCCALTSVALRTAAQIKKWRATAALLDNGATPIVVSMCDKRYMPAPRDPAGRLVYSFGNIRHSDSALFSDSTGYYQSAVEATAAMAPLRATTIQIAVQRGGELVGGEHFSIQHPVLGWRLYRVGRATEISDGVFEAVIRPPLREAIGDDTKVEFDRPRCVMRLRSPGAMDLALDLRRSGDPNIEFIETFDVQS